MIKVSIYEKNGRRVGFKCSGHAGSDEKGKDIVCASVSVLVINTINSIEKLTSVEVYCKENEKKGLIEYMLKSEPDNVTDILFGSLVIGLTSICSEVEEKYISIKFEEV